MSENRQKQDLDSNTWAAESDKSQDQQETTQSTTRTHCWITTNDLSEICQSDHKHDHSNHQTSFSEWNSTVTACS